MGTFVTRFQCFFISHACTQKLKKMQTGSKFLINLVTTILALFEEKKRTHTLTISVFLFSRKKIKSRYFVNYSLYNKVIYLFVKMKFQFFFWNKILIGAELGGAAGARAPPLFTPAPKFIV